MPRHHRVTVLLVLAALVTAGCFTATPGPAPTEPLGKQEAAPDASPVPADNATTSANTTGTGGNASSPSGGSPSGSGSSTYVPPPPARRAPMQPGPLAEWRNTVAAAVEGWAPVTVGAREVSVLATVWTSLGPEKPFSLMLTPSSILAPDAWARVDEGPVPFPDMDVYEGHVVGKPDQLARLTVTSEWARGAIRVGDTVHLIRMNLEGNTPRPIGAPDAPASATGQGEAPPSRFDPEDWAEEDCFRAVPPNIRPMLDVGRSTAAPLVARLILDGDAAFMERYGASAFPLMVAMTHETALIFEHEVSIRLQVVGLHLNTDPGYFPKPDATSPLGRLAEYWNARGDARDIVHLFTGHSSGYAQANCIGGAGKPEVAYTFTPSQWDEDYIVFHTNAYAHELGHIFSAHHHYGNHAETDGASIMIQGYTFGMSPVFSTLSKSVIRGWAEQHIHPAGTA